MSFRTLVPRQPLPETDCFTVQQSIRDGATVWDVAHFPTWSSTAPCCAVQVVQHADETEFAALWRAADAIAREHITRAGEVRP